MKKGLLGLAVLTLMLAGCGEASTTEKMKVGLIALHGDNSTYDKNFIDAFKAAAEAKGYEAIVKTNIDESAAVTEAADDMVDQGCKFVFADSFGHESYLYESAKKHTDVQFAHATGTSAHTLKAANFHNAFASIYQGRYLAGVVAGMKLATMNTASHKIGYVGAYPYAEVKSGYTSFYLGVRSIVADVTMDVTFTGSWYDENLEKAGAEKLIGEGCVLLSQHADSFGAPTACENANVPNVSYNGSTKTECPETYLVSSKINWQPYFEHAFDCTKNGTAIETDYIGALSDDPFNGEVMLTELGKNVATDTEAKVKEVAAKLKDGSLKVFDCANFTVNGEHLTEYKADVDGDYVGETNVIKTENGVTYFAESDAEFRSAPYFDIDIDGITNLDAETK